MKISFNSPVVLCFTAVCCIALLLGYTTGGAATNAFFSVYHSSMLSPLTWWRFAGHVFGHAGWQHFIGNIMLILVVGPLAEEKYGSRNLFLVILATALATGIASYVFFPHVRLLGASGVVFSLILLSSVTGAKDGGIPLTFLLVAGLYLGQQVYDSFFGAGNVSHVTHIIGGAVGAAMGFAMERSGMVRKR